MGFGSNTEFGSRGFGTASQPKKGESPKPETKPPETNRKFLDELKKKLQEQRKKP